MTPPTTNTIPSSAPQDLLFNAALLDQVVTGSAPSVADRLGASRMTMQGAIDTIKAFNSRGAWATGVVYGLKDVAVTGGIAYVAVIPHTAGTFATDLAAGRWVVHQGLTVADAASTDGGKGASQIGVQDAAGWWPTSAKNSEAILATAGRDLRGRLRDVRTFAGIVANGTTDDSTAFKAACVTARAGGYGIWFADSVFLLIEFATALSQVFISGPVSLVGANRKNCGFIVDKKVDNNPIIHDPLFCFGITSKGSVVDAWTGRMENIGIIIKAGCHTFGICCQFYEMQQAKILNNWYDSRAVTWGLAKFAGWWLCGNFQPSWAVGQTDPYGIEVIGNEGHASAYYQNGESISFTNLRDSIVSHNKAYGFSDDMAIHGGSNITFTYNTNNPLLGRFYVEDVDGILIHGNHLEHCKDPSGVYAVGSGVTGIRISHTATYAINNTVPANNNVTITNNRIVLPEGSYMAGPIYVENSQDGLIIRGNIIENQGTGTLDAATGSITLTQTATLGAWVGPAGNPDSGAGGVVRCRSAIIDGNICCGPGWSATEGSLGVSFSAGSTVAIGPIEIKGNICGAYFIPYASVNFHEDNRALPISTDPFKLISLISMYRTGKPVFSSVLTAAQNLTYAGHPIGSPADLLDSGGLDFFPSTAGCIKGLKIRVKAAANSSAFCFVRIKKYSFSGTGGTGGASSTVLTIATQTSSALSPLEVGAEVIVNGTPTGATISSFGTGTGGAGTYNLSTAITAATGSTITSVKQIGADTPFATISPASNQVTYAINFFNVSLMTFGPQDKIKVQLFFTIGQNVALEGVVDMFALYNGT